MRQEAQRSYLRRRDPRTAESYYQHRAVAAWKLARELEDGEVTHHVNGNPADNHPDNLWIFSSQRAHMLWHHYRWREARGVAHLFSFEEVLRASQEWVIR